MLIMQGSRRPDLKPFRAAHRSMETIVEQLRIQSLLGERATGVAQGALRIFERRCAPGNCARLPVFAYCVLRRWSLLETAFPHTLGDVSQGNIRFCIPCDLGDDHFPALMSGPETRHGAERMTEGRGTLNEMGSPGNGGRPATGNRRFHWRG